MRHYPLNECAPKGQTFEPSLGKCITCRVGTYGPAFSSDDACLPCAAGRVSGRGSAFCTTCPVGSYSAASGAHCVACPPGTTTATPGSASELRCQAPAAIQAELDAQFDPEVLIKKLVALPVFEEVPASEYPFCCVDLLSWSLSSLSSAPSSLLPLCPAWLGWLSASPVRLYRAYSQVPLRRRYLGQLFGANEQPAREDRMLRATDGGGDDTSSSDVKALLQLVRLVGLMTFVS